jgi:hypothetical protein
MSLTRKWKSYTNSQSNIVNYDKIIQHWELDYDNIITRIDNINNDLSTTHIGLCERCNNIIRKQRIGAHIHITNYILDKFDKLLMKLIIKIILKYKNKFETKKILKYNIVKNNYYKIDECVININAWNEQVVLEPSDYDKYSNLEIIK